MTRKDYILIAEVLRVAYHRTKLSAEADEGLAPHLAIIEATESMAESLKRDNPRFNPQHFISVVNGERDLNSRPGWR